MFKWLWPFLEAIAFLLSTGTRIERTTNITKNKMDFVSPFRLFVSGYQSESGTEIFLCAYYDYRSRLHLDNASKERFE